MIPRLVHGVGAAVLVLVSGCTPSWWEEDAQAQVGALLDRKTVEVLGDRAEWVIEPENEPEKPKAPAEAQPSEQPEKVEKRSTENSAGEGGGGAEAMQVDLRTALKTAVEHNRDYEDQRENLFLRGLTATRAQFDFGPQLQALVTPTFDDGTGRSSETNVLGNLSASQILPTGGTLFANSNVLTNDWGKSYSLTLSQPLLRGAGYENSHEILTQAERSVIYEIRDFELFRQDFSIRVATAFFDLIAQKRTVANEEANYREAVWSSAVWCCATSSLAACAPRRSPTPARRSSSWPSGCWRST